jgi:hypothetical protein
VTAQIEVEAEDAEEAGALAETPPASACRREPKSDWICEIADGYVAEAPEPRLRLVKRS